MLSDTYGAMIVIQQPRASGEKKGNDDRVWRARAEIANAVGNLTKDVLHV